MADRFPLILNTSTNQIQEIPSGDNLDLTGTGINNAGIITAGNVTIGAATTDLIVNGDARITGILTIGTSSLKLDGPNNLVNVGTALTLGHTQGLQFHTQNLHSAGFEVNQINVSGVATATTFKGDGDFVELDVDGHTNLDNVSIAGITTMSGNLIISNTQPKISLVDTNNNPDYDIINADGIFQVTDATNSANRFRIDGTGTVDIPGNATVSGNLSVGGVLTYEDVTNVDSVGIVTAREGVFLPDLKQLKLGNTAAAPDLYIWHNSGTNNSNISNKTGDLFIQGNNGSGTVVNQIAVKSNAAVELNYQGNKKFETASYGVKTSGEIEIASGHLRGDSTNGLRMFSDSTALKGIILNTDDHLIPSNDSASDLGLTGTRWRNVYADTFYGDGSNLTGITGVTINNNVNNRLVTATGTTGTLDGESTLTYDGSLLSTKSIRIYDNGASGPLLNVKADDHNPWAFAIGNDTYHNNDHSGLMGYQANTGNFILRFQANSEFKDLFLRQSDGSTHRDMIKLASTGSVELYAGGNKKLETTSTGISVTGQGVFSAAITASTYIQGTSSNGGLKFYSDSSTSKGVVLDTNDHLVPTHDSNSDLGLTGTRWRNVYADNLYGNGNNITQIVTAGSTYNSNLDTANTVAGVYRVNTGISNGHSGMTSYGTLFHANNAQDTGFQMYVNYNDGRAFLRGGNATTFNGSSGGGYTNTTWAEIAQSTQSFIPETNNNINLGSTTKRFANVYTNDLNLSNKGSTNSVDNTWGDFTIQEGESDLFLINNRSGKKYKFNLTEVS